MPETQFKSSGDSGPVGSLSGILTVVSRLPTGDSGNRIRPVIADLAIKGLVRPSSKRPARATCSRPVSDRTTGLPITSQLGDKPSGATRITFAGLKEPVLMVAADRWEYLLSRR